MSELVKTAQADRCLPLSSRLVMRISWTPETAALDMDIAAIANRMSEALLLAIHSIVVSSHARGAGD